MGNKQTVENKKVVTFAQKFNIGDKCTYTSPKNNSKYTAWIQTINDDNGQYIIKVMLTTTTSDILSVKEETLSPWVAIEAPRVEQRPVEAPRVAPEPVKRPCGCEYEWPCVCRLEDVEVNEFHDADIEEALRESRDAERNRKIEEERQQKAMNDAVDRVRIGFLMDPVVQQAQIKDVLDIFEPADPVNHVNLGTLNLDEPGLPAAPADEKMNEYPQKEVREILVDQPHGQVTQILQLGGKGKSIKDQIYDLELKYYHELQTKDILSYTPDEQEFLNNFVIKNQDQQ